MTYKDKATEKAYRIKYREQNKPKFRKYAKIHYQKYREQILAQHKERPQGYKKDIQKKYYEKNKQKILAKHKIKTKQYRKFRKLPAETQFDVLWLTMKKLMK